MNPRKPDALRTGHRKYPESIEAPDKLIVTPPLSPQGLDWWNRLLPLVEDLGIMTHVDAPALGVLSELCAKFQASPDAKVAAQIRAYLTQFGLTPSARAAFAKEAEKPLDPLAEFNLG